MYFRTQQNKKKQTAPRIRKYWWPKEAWLAYCMLLTWVQKKVHQMIGNLSHSVNDKTKAGTPIF